MTIELELTVAPFWGDVIANPSVVVPEGVGVATGVGAVVGGKDGCGVAVGVGMGMGKGVGVGGRVGVGNVGEGVGEGVGDAVGAGVGVGGRVGAGVSCTKIGSDDTGEAVGVADASAISVGWPAKTLATISKVMTVKPATSPARSQSRRGGTLAARRAAPPWTTPL
jgi:hypothetical protein